MTRCARRPVARPWGTAATLIAAVLFCTAITHSSRRAAIARPLVVAALAFAPVPGAVTANRAVLAALIERAAARGARFLVAPELTLIGSVQDACVSRGALAEPIPGASTAWLGQETRRHGVWASISLLERASDGQCYVSAVLLGPDGELHQRARKVLVDVAMDGGATAGSFRDATDSVDADGVRVGIVSAGDVIAGVPRLAQRGARIVLVNAGAPAGRRATSAALLESLAREHNVAIAVGMTPCAPGAACVPAVFGSPQHADKNADRNDVGTVVTAVVEPRLAWHVPTVLGLPSSVPVPTAESGSDAIAELGRRLFTDRGLSSTKQVACATCHDPKRFFTNGKVRGVGVHGRETKRNVPSLLNVAFRPLLQWDGYASSIENFVKYPLSSITEMDFHYLDKAVPYVRSRPEYVEGFRESFATASIEFEHIASALAAYQRTLVSGDAPFDRYQYGGESDALTPAARRGLELFTGRARCSSCHVITPRYALFTDFKYHRLGIGFDQPAGKYRDIGLGGISTNDFAGLFLTPSLRNVAQTAPYMHDGSLATLDDVISFYEAGVPPSAATVPLAPVRLTPGERRDLLAFLESLTGSQRYDAEGRRMPASPSESASVNRPGGTPR